MPRAGDIFLELATFIARLREQEKVASREREQQFDLAKQLAKYQTDERIRQEKAKFTSEQAPLGSDILGEVGKATNLSQLPTITESMSRLRLDPRFKQTSEAFASPTQFPTKNVPGVGTIEDVLTPIRGAGEPVPTEESIAQAILARRRQLASQPFAEAQRGPRIQGPEGLAVTGDPSAPVRTERTPSEQGARESFIEILTRPGAVERAGETARASTPPQIEPGLGPGGEPAFLRVPRFGGEAEVVPGGTPRPTAAQAQGSDFAIVAQNLQILETLSKTINVGQGFLGQYVPGQFRRAMGAIGEDEAAQLFTSLREPTALALASIVNGGRPTEPDKVAAARLIPDFTTTADVAAVLYGNMKSLLAKYQQGGYEAVSVGSSITGSSDEFIRILTTGLSPEQVEQLLNREPVQGAQPGQVEDAEALLRRIRGGGGGF